MFKNYHKILILCLIFIFILSINVLAEKYEGEPPDEFNQAPEFEKMVQQGELPPIEERLPVSQDIYVVEPVEEIGKYGGTIRTTTLAPNGYGDDNNLSIFTNPVKTNPTATKLVPHVAKEVSSSSNKKVWTMRLRKGLKWSDGNDFTADDILFWYEDVLLNDELTPAIGKPWRKEDEIVEIKKIDKYTVDFVFSTPRPFFKERLVHIGAWDLFFPKHFLKQYHPKYTSKKNLEEKVQEGGFDQWYELFRSKNSNVWGQPMDVDRPTLAPFKLTKKTSNRRIFERNPYYWKIDTAGNQLPYIDKIVTEMVSDVEVVQGMIMSGETDFAGMQATIENYPMYRKYEDKGNYKTVLWDSGQGNEVIYMLNQTNEDPVLREIFQDVRFRKALSVAIDRSEINEAIYFGRAEPRQYTVLKSSRYYEPEFANAYIDYNPEKAKNLLKEMGLVDKDGDGWRERPDGEKLTFTIEYYAIETPKQPNVELVLNHWKEIGIDVKSKSISGELQGQRAPANLMDATLWHGDRATDVYFPIDPYWILPIYPDWARTIGPEWAQWFSSDGENGKEPPAKVKKLYDLWEEVLIETDPQKQIELGKKMLRSQAENLWCIGTIGNAPYPIVLNNKIRNFPREGIWVWDTLWSCNRDPSQIFMEE